MATLRGRQIIDRIKRFVEPRFSLPVPPYGKPEFWDGVYNRMGPTDVFEWGGCEFSDFANYEYKLLEHPLATGTTPSDAAKESKHKATFEDTLLPMPTNDFRDDAEGEDEKMKDKQKLEAIVMLGCGNSRFGEDMIEYGRVSRGRLFRSTLLQVDVSSRVLDGLAIRCKPYIESGDMAFVEDDATRLSALKASKIQAIAAMDKGLIDALFCASEYKQIQDMVGSVHDILCPGGIFCFLSFSRPEFLLPKLSPELSLKQQQKQRALGQQANTFSNWQDMQIRELDKILLYRFQKSTNDSFSQPTRPSRKVITKNK